MNKKISLMLAAVSVMGAAAFADTFVTAKSVCRSPADFPAVIAAVDDGSAVLTGNYRDDEAYYRAKFRTGAIDGAAYMAAVKNLAGAENGVYWATLAYSFGRVAPGAAALSALESEIAAGLASGDPVKIGRAKTAAGQLAYARKEFRQNAALLLSNDVTAPASAAAIRYGIRHGGIPAADMFTACVNRLTSDQTTAAQAGMFLPPMLTLAGTMPPDTVKNSLTAVARSIAARAVVNEDNSNAADAQAWSVVLARVEQTLKRY